MFVEKDRAPVAASHRELPRHVIEIAHSVRHIALLSETWALL